MLKCHFPGLWFVFKFWLLCLYFFISCGNVQFVWFLFLYTAFDFAVTFIKFSNPLSENYSPSIFFQYSIFKNKQKRKQYITAGIHLTVGCEVRLLFLPLKWLPSSRPFSKASFLQWCRCEIVSCPCFYMKSVYIYTHTHTHTQDFFSCF